MKASWTHGMCFRKLPDEPAVTGWALRGQCSPATAPSCHRGAGAAQPCEASLSGLSVLITITCAKQRIQRRHRTQVSRTQRLWSWPLFKKTNSKVKSQLRQGKLCFLPTSQLESTFTEKEKKQMPESDTSQENKNGKKVALECDWESH